MNDSDLRTKRIRNARWAVVAILLLTAYLLVDFVVVERGSRGAPVFVLAALAGTKAYLRYLRLKRQAGLKLIGDDRPFD